MKILTTAALSIAALALTPAADAATLVVDLDDVTALGLEGTANNTILTYQIGAYAHVTSLAYDLTIATIDPGWISEQSLLLGSSDANYVSFTPGYQWETDGTALLCGLEDWRAIGLDFFVEDDGILRMEFIDTWNTEGTPNGTWNGQFVFTYDGAPAVPEPATWALMIVGFGAIGASLRSRRRVARLTPA